VQVDEMGFVVHSTLPYIGASPDRRVQISISGEAQAARYVQIKCPHSQKLDAFRSRLPDRVQVQVIAELAVLNSHPTLVNVHYLKRVTLLDGRVHNVVSLTKQSAFGFDFL
jgi:hypothetical protein